MLSKLLSRTGVLTKRPSRQCHARKRKASSMNRRQNDQITESGDQDAKSPLGRVEQEILALSKSKWDWMAERKVDALETLFHEKAVFVHMGGSMSRKQEIDTIRGGGIQYRTDLKFLF
jgi:hypothetical protein